MSVDRIAIKTTYFSLIGNTLLAVVKWTAGFFGNSYALIADAIESTTDILASFIVFLGIKYANRPADENHPYGHGRIEPLVTFLVVGFMFATSILIAINAIDNIRTPHELPKSFTLIVLVLIIIWKEISFRIVMAKGNKLNSTALKADAWHHRSDAITSVAAFIGISIAIFMGKGYEAADDWAALLAAGFILYNGYQIFRPALSEIMDEHIHDNLIDEIRKVSLTVEGIIDTEKCNVRKTGMTYFIDLHAIVNGDISVKEGHKISHELKDTLMQHYPQISDVLVHIEPNELI